VTLDLRAAEVFVAVADELHFGRAAQRVHMTQPAVSQQVRKLETVLGVRLLERSNRHVALTHEGTAFLIAAREAIAAAEFAVAAARRAGDGESGRLRVASSGSLVGELAGLLVQEFRTRHPAADVTLSQYDFTRSLAGLPTAEADVAVVRAPVGDPGLDTVPLVREPRVLVLAAAHPAAVHHTVRFRDIAGEPVVVNAASTQSLRDFWAGADLRGGRPYRIGASATNLGQWLAALVAGQGISLCPASTQRFYPDPALAFREVELCPPSIVSVAWPSRRRFPLLTRFVDAARVQVAKRPSAFWTPVRP
jgi:DNA-binding transcriptional LysR family regulator